MVKQKTYTLDEAFLQKLKDRVGDLQYGEVTIIIHNGKPRMEITQKYKD